MLHCTGTVFELPFLQGRVRVGGCPEGLAIMEFSSGNLKIKNLSRGPASDADPGFAKPLGEPKTAQIASKMGSKI